MIEKIGSTIYLQYASACSNIIESFFVNNTLSLAERVHKLFLGIAQLFWLDRLPLAQESIQAPVLFSVPALQRVRDEEEIEEVEEEIEEEVEEAIPSNLEDKFEEAAEVEPVEAKSEVPETIKPKPKSGISVRQILGVVALGAAILSTASYMKNDAVVVPNIEPTRSIQPINTIPQPIRQPLPNLYPEHLRIEMEPVKPEKRKTVNNTLPPCPPSFVVSPEPQIKSRVDVATESVNVSKEKQEEHVPTLNAETPVESRSYAAYALLASMAVASCVWLRNRFSTKNKVEIEEKPAEQPVVQQPVLAAPPAVSPIPPTPITITLSPADPRPVITTPVRVKTPVKDRSPVAAAPAPATHEQKSAVKSPEKKEEHKVAAASPTDMTDPAVAPILAKILGSPQPVRTPVQPMVVPESAMRSPYRSPMQPQRLEFPVTPAKDDVKVETKENKATEVIPGVANTAQKKQLQKVAQSAVRYVVRKHQCPNTPKPEQKEKKKKAVTVKRGAPTRLDKPNLRGRRQTSGRAVTERMIRTGDTPLRPFNTEFTMHHTLEGTATKPTTSGK